MEAEISFKQVGIANRRDGDGGNKITARRIFAIAFNGEQKFIPADTIAKAKFVIDMAKIFGVPVTGNRLDFTGEENLWYSFCSVALNSSIRTAQDVADCIAFEVK